MTDSYWAAVQDYSTQIDQNYARPAFKNIKVHFDERPVVSTFIAIFTLLSLVPVAFFAGTSICIFLTFTLAALSLALLTASAVIITLLSFLILILIGTFLISLFLTGIAFSSYLFLRLALHVRREGPSAGASEWGKETKQSLLSRLARQNGKETSDSWSNGRSDEKAPPSEDLYKPAE